MSGGASRFGVHVSVAGGVQNAPLRAQEAGCDCFQLFVANPRSWALPAITPEQAAAFRRDRERLKLGPVVVHATYLINLASVDPAQFERATEHFTAQYAAADSIGADFLVIHPGSFKNSTYEDGVRLAAQALVKAREACPDGPVLLLENTAGGGCTLGRTPQELADILRASGLPHDCTGVCFDTCHAWATGVELVAPGAFEGVMRAYAGCLWPGAVRVIHCNDSLYACGKGRDRHYHIGLGEIGEDGMRHILRCSLLKDVPVILETPIDKVRDDKGNLAAARSAAGLRG